MKQPLCLAAVLTLSLTGCHSGPPQIPRPPTGHEVLITEDQVKNAVEHEKAFAQYYDVPAPAGENWFAIDVGPTPVLVVAGHATAQTRNGTRRAADRGTGSLAVMLHKLTDATAIYTVYASPSDPNDDDDNAFKDTLSNLLHELQPALVLDLHASHTDRPVAVSFGTMAGQSLLGRAELLAKLEEALRQAGVQDLSNESFSAQRHHTITKWAAQQGVPGIQLEINVTWLAQAGANQTEARRVAKLLQGLVNFLQSFERNEATTESRLRPASAAR